MIYNSSINDDLLYIYRQLHQSWMRTFYSLSMTQVTTMQWYIQDALQARITWHKEITGLHLPRRLKVFQILDLNLKCEFHSICRLTTFENKIRWTCVLGTQTLNYTPSLCFSSLFWELKQKHNQELHEAMTQMVSWFIHYLWSSLLIHISSYIYRKGMLKNIHVTRALIIHFPTHLQLLIIWSCGEISERIICMVEVTIEIFTSRALFSFTFKAVFRIHYCFWSKQKNFAVVFGFYLWQECFSA